MSKDRMSMYKSIPEDLRVDWHTFKRILSRELELEKVKTRMLKIIKKNESK